MRFFIVLFLLIMLIACGYVSISPANLLFVPFPDDVSLGIRCGAVGGVGGAVYCLRAVYLNTSVYKRWDPDWHVWYFVRPVVSIACGAISFLFLQAGLMLLGADQTSTSGDLGFFAFAFVAGLNVDKFISKIEEIAQSTWGIERSRTSKSGDEN